MDGDGAVTAVRSFDPYGQPLAGDGGTPFGYAGEAYDAQVELTWLRARWLSESQGRFFQPDSFPGDPRRPLMLNVYLYALGNAINYIDPNGHEPGIPPVGGHLGRTGVFGAGTTGLPANPAAQSLTISPPCSQNEAMIGPGQPLSRPDEGVLLIYQDPGYAYRREEVVLWSSEYPILAGMATAGAELRQVNTWAGVLSLQPRASYREFAASVSAGVVLKAGGEWSSANGFSPGLELGVERAKAQLQPGQLMFQLGSIKMGVEWQMPYNKLFPLTQRALDEYGGIVGFSTGPAAGFIYIRSYTIKGQWYKDRWTSGYDQLLLWMWSKGWQPDPIPTGNST
jgi:RHS repeat-associated protein